MRHSRAVRLTYPSNTPSVAAPDTIDDNGYTPLCAASHRGLAKVAVTLLDAGDNVDFATPPGHVNCAGFTPLMRAVDYNRADVAMLLIKRGADGAKTTTEAFEEVDVGATALDIARHQDDNNSDCTETFALLRKRYCNTCGLTSSGLSAMTAEEKQHLKRCGNCPARGPRARYCSKACQRADWVPRNRTECAEAQCARQVVGATKV